MSKRKILWHGAHVEAMKLDLHECKDALSFTSEHQLSKEALIMDLLIIKKDPHIVIKKNVRGLDMIGVGDGIIYVGGDILSVQILESKRLPEDQNLFLKGLRRGNDADKMSKILKEYDNLVGMDTRNVYVDRLIQANEDAYREAIGMSEGLKRIMHEVAVEQGWLEEKVKAAARETAKKLLKYGDPAEKIAEVTNLPVEEVMELANTPVSAL